MHLTPLSGRFSPPLATLLAGLFVVLAATQVDAAKKKKRPPRRPNQSQAGRANPVLAAAFGDKYPQARLSPQQEAALVQVLGRHRTKLAAAMKAMADVYTAEQRARLLRARHMAIRAGVAPQNIEKRVAQAREAITFTEEQKKQMTAAKKQLQAVKSEVRQASASFLNPTQLNQLFGKGGGKKQKAKR